MIEALSKAPIVINGVVGQDFTGKNFSGVILQGVFTDCVFSSADFRGAIFEEGTKFLNCYFSGAQAQGTAIAKYITTSISPSEVISRTAQIDSSTAISSFALTTITPSTTSVAPSFDLNSVALATTNSIVSSLPKASSLFWPVAGTALGLAAFYGLYKANQYCLSLPPKGLKEYPVVVKPKDNENQDQPPAANPPRRPTRKRKERPNEEEQPNQGDQLYQGRPKRRMLNNHHNENRGAEENDQRPQRYSARIAKERISELSRGL